MYNLYGWLIMMSTVIKSQYGNCFIKCIQNLSLASLHPKEFYYTEKENHRGLIKQRVKFWRHKIPVNFFTFWGAFIHRWQHLIPSKTLFLAYIKSYQATRNERHIIDYNTAIKIWKTIIKLIWGVPMILIDDQRPGISITLLGDNI